MCAGDRVRTRERIRLARGNSLATGRKETTGGKQDVETKGFHVVDFRRGIFSS